MHAPSPFSASSSLSILRSAKLSRTPPVGLIRAVCLCEAAGALGAAGARHCQWTERLTLPGSCTQTHASRSPCYCFHLNPFLLAFLPTWVYACAFLISISCLCPPPISLFPVYRSPSSILRLCRHQDHTKERVDAAPMGRQCRSTKGKLFQSIKILRAAPHLDMKVENNYVQSKKKPVTFDSNKKVNQINCIAPSWWQQKLMGGH